MNDHAKCLPWSVAHQPERNPPEWSVYDSTGRLVVWFYYGGHYRRTEAEAEALARMCAAGSVEKQLREAIAAAGFGVMQAGGELSLHCVTDAAKKAEEVEGDLIADNIELHAALREAWCWLNHGDGGTPDKRGAKCDTFTEALEMIQSAIAKGEAK